MSTTTQPLPATETLPKAEAASRRLPPTEAAPPIDIAPTLARAQSALLSLHQTGGLGGPIGGYWCGELQGDSILQSEYILLKFILNQDSDPNLPLIANYLRGQQQADGGWNMYPGGANDCSGTVKAYFALKLMGDDPAAPHMQAARAAALSLGGVEACNSFTKFYFACLDQISFDACPTIPPEIVLLPKWLYFNLYGVSAWSRTMILPLALVTTLRPVRKLREDQSIQELIINKEAANSPRGSWKSLPRSWRQMFLLIDLSLKKFEKTTTTPLRPLALREAEKWILDHTEQSEGLGAIFPPMVYILIVFKALGYPDDHPRVLEAQRQLRDLFIREGDTIRIQPCFSPVWDTGIAMHALAESGLTPDHPAAIATTDWLLSKECRTASDWAKNCPDVEPSGWYFEYQNPHYPDVDDTAMVCIALTRLGGPRCRPAIKRGVNWLLAMQNDDGGWAAFDRTRNRTLLEHVPFADHNAIQDPSCPDITGRVFEGLGRCGVTTSHAAVRKGIAFIRQTQDKDGPWFGRWGVNYIYGTWQCLMGLKAVGENMDLPYIRRAANWLRACQKPDGSWGESCDSYEDPTLKGIGQSTPSQTAWGAMALMAVHGPHDPAVRNAMQWLAANQAPDGNWPEHFYTGTGFPRVFYLKYHLYRLYFPLMALGRYKRLLGQPEP